MNQSVRDMAQDARLAVDLASEAIASDILLLNISKCSDFADYFVIMTAETTRQATAIADDIKNKLKQKDVKLYSKQGTFNGGWIVLDYSFIMIHIFGELQRKYYNLEGFWKESIEILRIQ